MVPKNIVTGKGCSQARRSIDDGHFQLESLAVAAPLSPSEPSIHRSPVSFVVSAMSRIAKLGASHCRNWARIG